MRREEDRELQGNQQAKRVRIDFLHLVLLFGADQYLSQPKKTIKKTWMQMAFRMSKRNIRALGTSHSGDQDMYSLPNGPLIMHDRPSTVA